MPLKLADASVLAAHCSDCIQSELERVKGIEPSSQPWEGHILPLNHTRAHIDGCPTASACGTDYCYQTSPRLATGLHPQIRLRASFESADGFLEGLLDFGFALGQLDLAAFDLPDVKAVHRRTAFG